MPFEAANKIEEAARDPEKVAPQSGVYPIAVTRCDRCNPCYVFSYSAGDEPSPFGASPVSLIELNFNCSLQFSIPRKFNYLAKLSISIPL